MLLRACERVLHDRHDAEDICQAAFLLLAKKAACIPWRESVAGWLYETAYRLSLKARTTGLRRKRHEARAKLQPTPEPVAELKVREFQAMLDEELGRLPEKFRAPILLCCLEGKSRDEAARCLGWTLAAVKDRLERGRERLRMRLARRGVVLGTALTSAWLFGSEAHAGCGCLLPHAIANAAVSIASGNATLAGLLPAWIAELAKGATKTMFVRNVTILAVVGCALGLGVAGVAKGLPGEVQPALQEANPAKPQDDTSAPKKADDDKSAPKKVPPSESASAQPESVPLSGHKGAARAIAFSSDGKAVATAGADGTVRVWDPALGQQNLKLEQPVEAVGVAFSPDGKSLATARKDGVLTLFDAGTGKEIRTSGTTGRSGGAIAFSPDGKRIVTGSDRGIIDMFDVATGKVLFRFRAQGGVPTAAAFSPDGKLMAVGTGGGLVHLLEPLTGREVLRFRQGNGTVTGLAFLQEGRKVGMAGGGRAVGIFDVATGKDEKTFEAKEEIRALAFTADGKLAVTAGTGREIRLWDAAAGKEERQFVAPETTNAVVFSPDGKRIATAGDNGCVLLWDLTRDEKPLPSDFKLTDKDLTTSWADLGSDQGGKAYAALRMLRADPAKSIPFLQEQLKPKSPGPDQKKIDQLIADLDSEEFATREKASNELEKLGKLAEELMRKTLAAGPSLEVKTRLNKLLARLGGDRPLTADQQRDVRAVRVLEQIGTPEARKLLDALVKESPGWWVTQEAKQAIDRLAQREKK